MRKRTGTGGALRQASMPPLPPALLSLLLLLLCCSSFPLPLLLLLPAHGEVFPPSSSASISSEFIDLFALSLFTYQLQAPSFTGVVFESSSGLEDGLAAMRKNRYDWIVATSSMPDSLRATRPTLESYPIATIGVAPAYNLPTDVVGTTPLALDAPTLCRMWRANITHWNDSSIVATNPLLRLPGQPITFVQLDFADDSSSAVSRLCTKVDPGWAATIGITNWPRMAHTVPVDRTQGSPGVASFVMDNPYSIGIASYVAAIQVPRANMINRAGKRVAVTPSTVSQAFLEKAADGILPGGNGYDLSDPTSAFAWPVNIAAWVFIDTSLVRSTCSTKAEILKFLLWMYESPVVAALAQSLNIAMAPALYLEQTGLLNRLRRDVQCEGNTLVQANSAIASVRGNAMMASAFTLVSHLYSQIDSTYLYAFQPMDDSVALERIGVGEIDFAVVTSTALTDSQIAQFRGAWPGKEEGTTVPGGVILPSFMVGVVPTFSLPKSIVALHATRSEINDLGLPDLYPLQIDMETLAAVFLGLVRSWMDPRMLDLNPQLSAWFNRTGASTQLRSVVCCTNDADPFVAGTIVANHLLTTRVMNETLGPGGVALAQQNPRSIFRTLQALHTAPSPMSFVDREGTSSAKLTMQGGSVGYRSLNTASANPTTDFRMRVENMYGVVESVPATPDAIKACIAPFVRQPGFVDGFLKGGSKVVAFVPPPGCWPMQAVSSLAVASTFFSANDVVKDVVIRETAAEAAASHQSPCVRAQKNLELLRWIQTSELLASALHNSGVVHLSDFPEIRTYLVDQRLNHATCDGKTILITLPIIWDVPGAATGFAIALACLIIVACAATIGGLYRYRHHPAIRGASPPFLAQVAVGLALLASSLIAWSSPVTDSSCLAFQWLVDLGFTLAFAPLFAKTWRIYQIFSAKKIKVVKISNGRLVWAVLAMLAFELVVLAVWTGVSPLQPVLYEQPTNQLDGAIRQLTHCAVEGGAGTAFLALEASFKGALLLFGCLMGFSTRKVSASFNESSTIAWAIYNVVFTSLVVGAILLFLDTLGDTLIWIVLILFLWIAVGTWLLIFVPKASAVLASSEDARLAAQSISLGSLSKHDGSITFASITGMGRAQLQAYRTALEAQLDKVKRALGLTDLRALGESKVLHGRSFGSDVHVEGEMRANSSDPHSAAGRATQTRTRPGSAGADDLHHDATRPPRSRSPAPNALTVRVDACNSGGGVAALSPSSVANVCSIPRHPVRRGSPDPASMSSAGGIVTISVPRLRGAASHGEAHAHVPNHRSGSLDIPARTPAAVELELESLHHRHFPHHTGTAPNSPPPADLDHLSHPASPGGGGGGVASPSRKMSASVPGRVDSPPSPSASPSSSPPASPLPGCVDDAPADSPSYLPVHAHAHAHGHAAPSPTSHSPHHHTHSSASLNAMSPN